MKDISGLSPRLRPLRTAWIVAWLAAAALFAVSLVVWGDEPVPPLAEEAVQQPSDEQTVAPGVVARVIRVETSAVQSTITVEVAGRDDLGPNIAYGGLALLLADGRQHPERGSEVDGRTVTFRFPGAAILQPGTATLHIPKVGITQSMRGGRHAEGATYFEDTLLTVQLPVNDQVTELLVNARAPFGPGEVSVNKVIRDGESVVVAGTLQGFTREQIQSLDLRGSSLVLNDGVELRMSGGRHGYGEALRSFELHFSAADELAPVSRLVVSLAVAPIPDTVLRGAPSDVVQALEAVERASGAETVVDLAP